jgi:fatty acid desaturase
MTDFAECNESSSSSIKTFILIDGIRKEIKDIMAERKEYYFKPPSIFLSWMASCIKDDRDFPILYMFFNVAVMTLPAAAIVFACESHLLGFIYWIINTALFQERFLIGLHYYSHRGLFKNTTLNTIVPLVFSPFFGMPSGMYYLHHVIMHHSENNLDQWDLSSTEPFQRDKVTHFLFYWLRFAFAVWIELPLYAWKRSRYTQALSTAFFIFAFWAVMAILYFVNPCGTFWVFLFPLAVNSFLLMLGNWSQHIFVDPNNPRSNYHLAYNVINDQCNQRSFNDGYHIEHHLNSKRHWSELPSNFQQNYATYAKEDAIVFENLDPIKVGILVFLEKYNVLAKHLVQFRTPPRSAAEVEAFLRSRLVPIPRHAKTK